jgi:hypothetical protein
MLHPLSYISSPSHVLQVVYQAGPSVTAASLDGVDVDAALLAANAAKLTVVCVGEDTYAEKPGDSDTIELAQGQVDVRAP